MMLSTGGQCPLTTLFSALKGERSMTFWGQRCADTVWWVVIIKAWKRPLLTNSRPVINLNDGRNLLFSPKSSRVVEHTERKGAELVPKKEMFQKIFISHDPSVTATICSRIVSVPGQKLVPNWLSRLKGGGLWGGHRICHPIGGLLILFVWKILAPNKTDTLSTKAEARKWTLIHVYHSAKLNFIDSYVNVSI